jgi:hypothetical protein
MKDKEMHRLIPARRWNKERSIGENLTQVLVDVSNRRSSSSAFHRSTRQVGDHTNWNVSYSNHRSVLDFDRVDAIDQVNICTSSNGREYTTATLYFLFKLNTLATMR